MRAELQLGALFATLAIASPAPLVLLPRQSCSGDSCQLADVSRSTGNGPPSTAPSGVSLDQTCIANQLAQLDSENRLPPNSCPGQVIGPCTSSASRLMVRSAEPGLEERQSCTPYTLIYARGTFEVGDLGQIVGGNLANDLTSTGPGLWTITPVSYDNSVAGYNCLGMPGGYKGISYLENTVAKYVFLHCTRNRPADHKSHSCPNTKIIVSGYSQGAMVAHNLLAWAHADARSHVAGVVTFGDPFNGAKIYGFDSGLIHTECDPSDNICQGGSMILPAHLGYGGAAVDDAVAWIKRTVGQT